jgi:hypothetical protein
MVYYHPNAMLQNAYYTLSSHCHFPHHESWLDPNGPISTIRLPDPILAITLNGFGSIVGLHDRVAAE